MNGIQRIGAILDADGYQTTLAAVDGKDPTHAPLVVPFRPDELGRELALLVEVMPRGQDDETSFLNFSLLYPFAIDNHELVGELARAIFLLNRFLPIGSNGFCEQTPAAYFTYKLTVHDVDTVDASVITEVVNMIGYFTRRHSRIVGQILAGEATCDNLLAELQATGNGLPPLFLQAVNAGNTGQPFST